MTIAFDLILKIFYLQSIMFSSACEVLVVADQLAFNQLAIKVMETLLHVR